MADISRKRVATHLELLLEFIQENTHLVNTYIVEFFSKDLYRNLPSTWRKSNESCAMEELAWLIGYFEDHQCHTVWPLSLLCVRKILQMYSLPRKLDSFIASDNTLFSMKDFPVRLPHLDHLRVRQLFITQVKAKKREEIDRVAKETAFLAAKSDVKWIIDIGSGVGHLSRMLAFGYGLRVCGIEAQKELTLKAKDQDQKFLRKAKKLLSSSEYDKLLGCQPFHMNAEITFDTTGETLTKLIAKCSGINESQDFGVVGLHPCGDLAPMLLEIMINCPNAKFISIIGCCYHKMNFNEGGKGFPLSSAAKSSQINVSREAAAGASHAIEVYSSRLLSGDYDNLKIHCYRAVLETLIGKRWPQYVRSALNNVRLDSMLTFPMYCDKALKKLNLTIPADDLTSDETLDNLSRWKDVVFFYCIWTMMVPAVESIFQLDRFLYLIEQGIHCKLQAVFDPVVSPRNLLLSAIKKQ